MGISTQDWKGQRLRGKEVKESNALELGTKLPLPKYYRYAYCPGNSVW